MGQRSWLLQSQPGPAFAPLEHRRQLGNRLRQPAPHHFPGQRPDGLLVRPLREHAERHLESALVRASSPVATPGLTTRLDGACVTTSIASALIFLRRSGSAHPCPRMLSGTQQQRSRQRPREMAPLRASSPAPDIGWAGPACHFIAVAVLRRLW